MTGWQADARRDCLTCNEQLTLVAVTIRNTGDGPLGPFVVMSVPPFQRTVLDQVDGESEVDVRLYEAGSRIDHVVISRIGAGSFDRLILEVA